MHFKSGYIIYINASQKQTQLKRIQQNKIEIKIKSKCRLCGLRGEHLGGAGLDSGRVLGAVLGRGVAAVRGGADITPKHVPLMLLINILHLSKILAKEKINLQSLILIQF